MLVYVLLLAAATPEVVYQKSETQRPYKEEPYKDCWDGSRRLASTPCPSQDDRENAPPSFAIDLPARTISRVPRPKNNPGEWVTTNDYPSRSLQMEEEGVVGFKVEVSYDGRVSTCTVTFSSGSASLDAATCSNVTRRARFVPALDDDGNPTVGYYSNRVSWQIPAEPSYAIQIEMSPTGPQAVFGTYTEIDETVYPLEALEKGWGGSANIVLNISASGSVTGCSVKRGTGKDVLDSKSCVLASQWTFLPALNESGKPVSGTTTYEFSWELPDAWKTYQRTGFYPKKPI